MNRHELKDLFKIRDILFMHRHEVKELRCGDFARIATLTFEKGMVISSYEHTILYDYKHTWDFYYNIRIQKYRFPDIIDNLKLEPIFPDVEHYEGEYMNRKGVELYSLSGLKRQKTKHIMKFENEMKAPKYEVVNE